METTTNEKITEKNDETLQAANKWMNETGSLMVNVFNRQLNLAFDFYRNLFNSFSAENKNGNGNNANGVSPILNGGPLFNSMFKSFKLDGNFSNPVSTQFENMNKNLSAFTSGFFNSLQKELQQNQMVWTELSEKQSEMLEERLKSNQAIINSAMELYFKQINAMTETFKKLYSESGNQFNSLVKQNEKAWSDILKTGETMEKTEKEEKTENKFVPSKKQTVTT